MTPQQATTIAELLAACRRVEGPSLIARLSRMLGDVGLAEEVVQDCFVTALEQWPDSGVPDNPGAWLQTTAARRAIDQLRHRQMANGKHRLVLQEMQLMEQENTLPASWAETPVDDDMLRLIFTACHPVLSVEARLALTLRLVAGLSVREISRALLVSEAAVAQRITRAKRALADDQVAFELPSAVELGARLSSVLGVIYLIFNEGYSATQGDDWLRSDLCREAMRLGRQLCRLAPFEPEVFGLTALLELQGSRLDARLDEHGRAILLADQDRRRWDRTLIDHGLAALVQASSGNSKPGYYTLQARIAASHAIAATFDDTDWQTIAGHYDELHALAPGPVIQLNRAVAHGMAFGARAGLTLLETLADDQRLKNYHLFYAVRGDLLEKNGDRISAAQSYRKAAELTENHHEKQLLSDKAAHC
ncbi:MAG: RNA polymerase sigma factor [Gammaproteobacteria bacterium]|nr:RNA polymerase sigma factor [Gammaproteobacteria bacterium]